MKKRKHKHKPISELAKRRAFFERPPEEKAWERPPLKVTDVFEQYNVKKYSHYIFVQVSRVSTVKQAMDGNLSTAIYRMERFSHENNLMIYHTPTCIVHSAYYSGNPKELTDERFQANPQFYPNPKHYKPHYPVLKNIVDAHWTSIVTLGATDKFAFLFECVDRAIRSDDYDCRNNKDAPLTEEELKMFREVMRPFPGIRPFPAITICHPLDTFDEIDSWRKKYGAGFKPIKLPITLTQEYEMFHDESIELQLEGKSHREISELTGIPIERIRSWWLKCPQYYPKN